MAGENKMATGIVVETKKATFLIVTIIALAMFMLGFVSSSNRKETTSFTYDEIKMIEKFKSQVEEDFGSKVEVIVYKDKKGNLMLGWDD